MSSSRDLSARRCIPCNLLCASLSLSNFSSRFSLSTACNRKRAPAVVRCPTERSGGVKLDAKGKAKMHHARNIRDDGMIA